MLINRFIDLPNDQKDIVNLLELVYRWTLHATKSGSDLQCPPLQPAVSIQVLFSFKWQPFLRGRVERSLASDTCLLSLAALLVIPAEICFWNPCAEEEEACLTNPGWPESTTEKQWHYFLYLTFSSLWRLKPCALIKMYPMLNTSVYNVL